MYAGVVWRLGLLNVIYVAYYRFSLASGFRKRLFSQKCFSSSGEFFGTVEKIPDYPVNWQGSLLEDAQRICNGELRYYAHHWRYLSNPPDWFVNPFIGERYREPGRHWTELPDFHSAIGDIKNIWEASRFEWVVTLARAYRVTGDVLYLNRLNEWLADWCRNNPLNTGPNWKCGQEAAIRVINLLFAAYILDQWRQTTGVLQECISVHLERISANIRYAIAQDNNHGTSEAAALFIAGNWLARVTAAASETKRAKFLACKGRMLLENRLKHLVAEDGGFAQHSVNYHRLLLDTLVFVEFWRRKMDLPPFSAMAQQRMKAALSWLLDMTDGVSGDAPNLGANDGAFLVAGHSCRYRNFRPSIQTAAVLLYRERCYPPGAWDEPLFWLGFSVEKYPLVAKQKKSQLMPSGYVLLGDDNSWCMLRLPIYRFRPSHADALHLDVWHNGVNVVRDAGTFSYNTDDKRMQYYPGTVSHSTACFDGRDQMPRLGRFLFGAWLKPVELHFSGERGLTSCAYLDWQGARHRRQVQKMSNGWRVVDRIEGFRDEAIIRWHLVAGEWLVSENSVSCKNLRLQIAGEGEFIVQLSTLPNSLHYLEEKKSPVAEIICKKPMEITTEILLIS